MRSCGTNCGSASATTNSIARGTKRPGLPGRFVFVAWNEHACASGEFGVMGCSTSNCRRKPDRLKPVLLGGQYPLGVDADDNVCNRSLDRAKPMGHTSGNNDH